MRNTILVKSAAASGAILIFSCCVLSGCGGSGSASAAAGTVGNASAGRVAHAPQAASGQPAGGSPDTVQTASLGPASQSIIYTARLTMRTANVTAAAQRASSIVRAAGGYTADEHLVTGSGGKARGTVGLTLKIPAASYQTVLGQLTSASLGTEVALQQRSTDVTGQVADVSSRVTSQRDAIAQLRALLRRAGTVTGLLQVQQQISQDETTLEALLAQQRALDHETSYATVTMTLTGPHQAAPHHQAARRDFLTGLTTGWRALRHATGWLLTVLGAALPFLIVVAVVGGLGYGTRRRVIRHRAGPTAAS